MPKTMTIERARAEKIKAESKILKIIKDFQDRSGVSLVGCDVECFTYRELGSEPNGRITSVSLRVEL